MMGRRAAASVALAAGWAVLALPDPALSDDTGRNPVSIPSKYDFCPKCASDLLLALQHGDMVRMRRHAWSVFAGMTLQAPQSTIPIFQTWFTKEDLFPKSPREPKGAFGFEIPRQLLDDEPFRTLSPGPVPADQPILSKIYYNQDLYDYAVTKKHFNQTAGLCDVKKKLDQEHVETEDRRIPAFPRTALAVKTAWWVARAHHFTPLPVWDPEANSAQVGSNAPIGIFPHFEGAWSRAVAIAPFGVAVPQGQLVDVDLSGVVQRAHAVPLSGFHAMRIASQVQLDEITNLVKLPFPVEIGDYAILVGLHFTTKEIPNWLWATFWWHDEPDRGPYAAQRPSLLLRPWRNYLMNVSYSMTDPPEADGQAHIAFNPYLEGQLKGGITSNCMSCHLRAAWPPDGTTNADTSRGEASPADARLKDLVQLDFLWSFTRVSAPKNGCY